MITIKQSKQVREQLQLTHLVLFGIDTNGVWHVATNGKTKLDAEESAKMGNHLKDKLEWPQFTRAKSLERICKNCSFFQRGYHRPGDVIESNMHGKCMFNPEPIRRFEEDRACGNMEPSC